MSGNLRKREKERQRVRERKRKAQKSMARKFVKHVIAFEVFGLFIEIATSKWIETSIELEFRATASHTHAHQKYHHHHHPNWLSSHTKNCDCLQRNYNGFMTMRWDLTSNVEKLPSNKITAIKSELQSFYALQPGESESSKQFHDANKKNAHTHINTHIYTYTQIHITALDGGCVWFFFACAIQTTKTYTFSAEIGHVGPFK